MLNRLKLYLAFLFTASVLAVAQPNITKLEYYVDADPGAGARVDIPITATADLDISFDVPTASLTEGFHTLTILAQDVNLVWSHFESRIFYVNQSSTLAQNNISKVEYFIDDDPGHGAGVDVPVTAATTLDFLQNIPTTALSEGFHLLTIRAQDANGQWSLSEGKVFFVNQSVTIESNDITKMEYFIDADPGQGAGVDIPLTAGMTLNVFDSIPTASLSEGFHLLTIRAQDENGQWSLSENRAFYVNLSSTITQNNITKIEYFIDADSTQGAGIDVPITATVSIDSITDVATASLSEGFHLISVRAQDEGGQWGLTERKVFYVNQSVTQVANEITKMEYFIDTDPGQGAGIDIPLTANTTLNVLDSISTGSLADGFHVLVFRAQDENGQWSLAENRPFFVDQRRQIVSYEYALDTDPGVGLATSQAVTPQEEIDVSFDLTTDAEDLGSHNLYVRVKDENEFWSKTEIVPFMICDGALPDFTMGAITCAGTSVSFTDISTMTMAGDVYSWDFDGDGFEDDNTVGDVSFTYATAGTYDASLTLDRAGCISTITKTVVVNALPVVVASASATTVVLGNQVTLFGSGATSYTWDNGVVDNVAFNPTTTTTYTVTGTDGNGCESSESIEIVVVSPEIEVFEGADNTGTLLADAQTDVLDFGSAIEGNDIVRTFAIENTGTSDLNIASITSATTDFVVDNAITAIAAGVTEAFTVTLSSANVGTFSSTITITNDDENEAVFTFPVEGTIIADNLPPDLFFVFYVDENTEMGTRIGSVTADPASSFSILSGNTNDAFALGETSGDLTVASKEALDFETTPSFNLLVEADDGNGGMSMVSIIINLRDIIDENPLAVGDPSSMFDIYPNPTTRVLYVDLKGSASQDWKIQMYTVSGSLVLDLPKTQIGTKIELRIDGLKPGIYLLKIQGANEVFTKNILVR